MPIFNLTEEPPTFELEEESPAFEIIEETPGPNRTNAGGVMNALEQIPGGATAALVEVGETLKSVGDFIRDQFPSIKKLDPGDRFKVPIPQFEEPQSATAGLIKGATQFLTAFLPFARVAKGIGITGAFAKGMTAGALADLTAFDPDDPKLADMINELAPALKNPLTEYLASDPNDSDAEKRFKRALEGAGLGVVTEGLFRTGRAIFAARKAKALRLAEKAAPEPETILQRPTEVPVEQVDEAIQPQVAQTDEAITPSAISIEEDIPLSVAAETPQLNPNVPRLATDISGQPEVLPKYAGSINLERMQTDDGVKRAMLEASNEIPKRAPITVDESIEIAASLGYTLDDAERLASATQAQRHGAKAARDVLATVAETYEQARATWVQSQDPADFARLQSAETAFLRSFKATQQIASEIGFALQSFRQAGKADFRTITEKAINKLMAQLLGKGKISAKITARLASLDKTNPEEVHAFLEYMSTQRATTPDKLFEAFLSSILSGPQTHAANILGNFANIAIRPLERIATASADIFLSPIKPRDRFFGEAAIDIMGMTGSFHDAIKGFSRTMRTGMASFGTKFEVAEAGAKIGGRLGTVVRTPLRLLSASDEFFKIIAKGGDLKAQAYRLGVKKGLKGGELLDFTANAAAKPTEDMLKAAQHEAAYRTFTKELGTPGQTISRAIRILPGVRYLAPFVRTPINIAKFGLERTPLKAFDLIHMAAKGRLSKNGELSEEVGKLAIGLGMQAWVATQVIAGNLTGSGPSDPGDRKTLEQIGWQPQSLRLLGKHHSYSRLEPFATSIGIMADATELLQAGLEVGVITELEKDEIVNGMMAIVVQNISDKTFLQGLSDTSNVLSDPGRYFDRWSRQRIRAIVPNVIGQVARAQDPEARKLYETFDAIRSQLPRIGDFKGRQGLFPRRDYFGEPVEQEGNFWYRYLVPIRTKTLEATPAELKIAEVGARVAPLSRNITIKNHSIKLTPAEYDRHQELAGRWAKIQVEALTPALSGLTKEQQLNRINKAFTDGRAIGRELFVAELLQQRKDLFPTLQQ